MRKVSNGIYIKQKRNNILYSFMLRRCKCMYVNKI